MERPGRIYEATIRRSKESTVTDKESLAQAICDSEQMMWLMAGSNYPEMHLADLRRAYREYVASGGGYRNKK